MNSFFTEYGIAVGLVLALIFLLGVLLWARHTVLASSDEPLNVEPDKQAALAHLEFLRAVAGLHNTLHEKIDALLSNRNMAVPLVQVEALIERITASWAVQHSQRYDCIDPDTFRVQIRAIRNGSPNLMYFPKSFEQHIRECKMRGLIPRK